MINIASDKKIRFDYKWVIISLCFLMIFICLGFCSSNRSLYTYAITEALDIPRSVYTLNETFRYVSTAVVNIFFGSLIARFGPKKLICSGFVALIISCILYSVSNEIWQFYLAGIFLGIGMAWTTTTMIGCVVNKWCSKNKGTVMGAVLAANGLGGAVAAQIVTPIIYEEGNAFGYKSAYFLTVFILIVVGLIILFFFRDEPKEKANIEQIDVKKQKNEWDGIKFQDAVRKKYFFTVCVCIFLSGFILQGITGVASLHIQDIGISHSFVATVLSVHSIILTVAKFLTGVIYDKFGLRRTTVVSTVSAVIALISLMSVTNSLVGCVLSILYAVFAAFALPLETIMLPIYAGDLFGQRSYDKILGIFVSVNMVGYALGCPAINFVYDLTGSYSLALIVCTILMLIVIVLMQYVISSAAKVRLN